MNRNTEGRARLMVAVMISLLASVTLSFLQVKLKIVHHDLSIHYPFFWNNFHALNSYQTFAWWMPDMTFGYPGYYFSMVGGINIKSPIFMLFGFFAYGCGIVGIHLQNIFLFYQLYVGVAIPLAFVLSTFLLARLIFQDKKVVYFVTILAAFSPAVVLNLSDPGNLEPLANDIFWTFALLSYLRKPCVKSFLVLGLASGILMLSLGYGFITWGPIYFPLLFICCLVPLRGAKRIIASLRVMPRSAWMAFMLLCVVCAAPSLLAMRDGKNFSNFRTGELSYSYTALKMGNPIEALSASTPSVFFNWNAYISDPKGSGSNQFLPLYGQGGYTYLGLPVLALAGLGLLYGRRSMRLRMMVMGMGVFMVGLLAGFSPLFSTILFWETPLRGYNHFSDLLYRGGGCTVLIFMAGLGLEALLRRGAEQGGFLLRLLGISVVLGAGFMFYVRSDHSSFFGGPFGFFLMTAIFMGVALFHVARAYGRAAKSKAATLVLVVLLLDVSTVSFGFVRSQIGVIEPLTDLGSGGPQTLGMVNTNPAFDYIAKLMLVYRPASELALGVLASGRAEEILSNSPLVKSDPIDPKTYTPPFAYSAFMSSLEQLTVYPHVQFVTGDEGRSFVSQWETTFTGIASERILPIRGEDEKAWQAVFARPSWAIAARTEKPVEPPLVSKRTYLTLAFNGVSDSAGAVLIRMPWHRFWGATVNGESVPVARAAFGLSAVPIPKGKYEVVLSFDPIFVRLAFGGAYAALLLWCVVLLRRDWRHLGGVSLGAGRVFQRQS